MKHVENLIVIDGYGFLFRAYHSMPPLTRADGTPIGAVYGFVNMISRIVENMNASHIAVVFDSGGKNFRHELYEQYKAHRPPVPEDLKPQFSIIREATDALGLYTLEKYGHEADDIIATIAKRNKEIAKRIVIISSDKDLMQLIDDDVVVMYDPLKNKFVGSKEVEEKFGIPPMLVRDALAMIGDSADNIPGIPSIGPKTAAELLKEYGSLDQVLANVDKIKQEKRKKVIEENREKALLSYKLVSLDMDVDIDTNIEHFITGKIVEDKLLSFLNLQGFRSIIPKIKRQFGITTNVNNNNNNKEDDQVKVIKDKIIYLNTDADFHLLENNAKKSGKIAIYQKNDKIALSTNYKEYYITKFSNLDNKYFKSILVHDEIRKITYSAKDLIKALELEFTADDIMLLSYILDGNKSDYGIDKIILNNLEMDLTELISSSEEQASLFENPKQDDVYLASIAVAIIKLFEIFKNRLIKENSVTLYERFEKPLSNVIAAMEMEGITLSAERLKKLSAEFQDKIAVLEDKIFKLCGTVFNIGSPKQLGEVLFGNLKIKPIGKESKTGNFSTGAEILEDLSVQGYEIADLLLEWRGISKLKSTYTDSLINQIDPKTGRVHTNYNMAQTTTGRLSSSNPNLQNIPIRSDEGNKIREAFISKEGYSLLSADYSQVELRILAEIANIGSLKDAFLHGKDIHATTASQIFGVDPSNVDSHMRRKAKAINFGIIYGISAPRLAKQISVTNAEAASYMSKYFAEYPGIKQYMEETKDFAKSHGYVVSMFGRKCFVRDIKSSNHALRSFSERAAINGRIQGTASDIIKKAMVNIYSLMKKQSFDAKMLLQVHDELVFEVRDDQATEFGDFIKAEMEKVAKFSIPLIADVSIGKNWAQL